MELRPCARCSRHVDELAVTCPFCGNEIEKALPGAFADRELPLPADHRDITIYGAAPIEPAVVFPVGARVRVRCSNGVTYLAVVRAVTSSSVVVVFEGGTESVVPILAVEPVG